MEESMPGELICDRNGVIYRQSPSHREWVSPATVTWMLKELVENDTAHSDLTDTLDWY